jgi:RNA polymerase sigma-70 factor (ECF subfamily)
MFGGDELTSWGNLLAAPWSIASTGVLPAMFALAAIVPTTTDEELVVRCKAGDRYAFGELVERYQDRIYGLCLRWLGEPLAAEEVAQDVFLSAWRGLPGFREEARFDTWLRRVAVNKCKNRRLHHKRRAHDRHDSIDAQSEDDDKPLLQLVHGGPSSDAKTMRDEASVLLQGALDALPEEQRSIVLMRDLEDLTYEEIAEALDVPRGTVKSRLHRARAMLARALSGRIGREDVF